MASALGVLQSAIQLFNRIVVTGLLVTAAALVFYILLYNWRSQIARAYTGVLLCMLGTYLGDLLTQISQPASSEFWLRSQWLGIAFAPAATLGLADALLRATGDASPLRRLAPKLALGLGMLTLGLIAFSDLIANPDVSSNGLPHLQAGPLFYPFSVYYFASVAWAMYSVLEARRRSLTATSRRRMTYFALAFIAVPLSLFPYLLPGGWPRFLPELLFWTGVTLTNMALGAAITLMGYTVAYFGASAPDRVIKRRMVKYLIRGPLLAAMVIAALAISMRIERWLDLPGFFIGLIAAVVIILATQLFIVTLQPWLDRLIAGEDSEEASRLQQFTERLMTRSDLIQYLENILAALCDLLRARLAFVTNAAERSGGRSADAITVIIGNLEEGARAASAIPPSVMQSIAAVKPGLRAQNDKDAALEEQADDQRNGSLRATIRAMFRRAEPSVRRVFELEDDFVLWEGYWLIPLWSSDSKTVLGVIGLAARAAEPDLTDEEREGVAVLITQAARALEDAAKQRRAFEALEQLIPEAIDMQRRLAETQNPAAPRLTDFERILPEIDRSDFTQMVRDALSQYWGGPKLTNSPLLGLRVVAEAMRRENGNPTKALRRVLEEAIEQLKPSGTRSFTSAEWLLYNILELKILQNQKVRDVARRLVMSESDLYRKQRMAIEEVARIVMEMEREARQRELAEVKAADLSEPNEHIAP
ncbi:MAG: hypothetical protein ACK4WM_06750 [Thermoflexales bacterium]